MVTRPLTAERLSYSVNDAAHALGVSERSIYNLIYGGKLRRLKVGRRVVIPAADLHAILEGGA